MFPPVAGVVRVLPCQGAERVSGLFPGRRPIRIPGSSPCEVRVANVTSPTGKELPRFGIMGAFRSDGRWKEVRE